MNYTNLWDRFFEVKDFWQENRKLLEDFSNFIKEKAEIDRSYAKGLEKLSKINLFEKVFGTVSPVFQGLKIFYSQSASHLISHADYLQDEVIMKLKKIISSHDAAIQDFKSQGKKLVLEREKLVKSHLKSRDRYWKVCKDNEQVVKPTLKAMQLEETYNKSYMFSINHLNSFNQNFHEGINKVLQVHQEQTMEKLLTLRHSLQIFIANEASSIYSMKMHLDGLPLALDTFNPEIDERMFIDSTYTGRQLELESFISYAQSQTAEPSPDADLVKIINSCWEGVQLAEENFQYFESVISKSEGQKKFITLLNEKRKNGLFKIPKLTFDDLGILVNKALNRFNEIEHLALAKQCIILSQTFFKVDDKDDKVFLQTLVMNHKLWKKEDYWEFMVDNAVDCALDNLTEFGDETVGDELEEKKRSVIVSAIISYTHMMASFNVDKSKIVRILERGRERYELSISELPIEDILMTVYQ